MRFSHSLLFDLDRVRTLSGAPHDEVCRATLKATDETLYGPSVATVKRKLWTWARGDGGSRLEGSSYRPRDYERGAPFSGRVVGTHGNLTRIMLKARCSRPLCPPIATTPTKGHQQKYTSQYHDPTNYCIAKHVEGQADDTDPSAEKDQTERANNPYHQSPPVHSATKPIASTTTLGGAHYPITAWQ